MIINALEFVDTCSNWHEQIANLVKRCWQDASGKCIFPYKPLAESSYWENHVQAEWRAQTMHSWFYIRNGAITAHVGLIQKDGYFELGRWLSDETNPKGIITTMCERVLREFYWERILVETTQAHTRSQAVCVALELRFAGLGMLPTGPDGNHWDIIYFDNDKRDDFIPDTAGAIGNPLGKIMYTDEAGRERLRTISRILSVEKGGILPPTQFHILPQYRGVVEEIIRKNIS